jgi:branched-chain amino acid transport system permease protein
MVPFAYFGGYGFYLLYYRLFEAREKDSLRGMVFFFGIMFLIQVGLLLGFGVDYQSVQTSYTDITWVAGPVELPLRMLVPFCVSIIVIALLSLFLTRSFTGRALRAVSQDGLAVALMGLDPIRIKAFGFGISVALGAIAGALLIVIQPVEPSMGAVYIGTTFAICVLGGMGSIAGTLIAAILLGVAESVTATFWGPSWSPALAFGTLIGVIGLRPRGIMGRR